MGRRLLVFNKLHLRLTLHVKGGWRATIEGVRTVSSKRGKGIGTKLIKWAIQRATLRGCHLVQLTTDKERQEALQFYKKLGFKDSHEGLKLFL